MGFMQDVMPALTPALTREIDARSRRADDERAEKWAEKRAALTRATQPSQPDPVPVPVAPTAETERDSAEVRRHKQWMAEQAAKTAEPTRAPPAANDDERDLRLTALDWALEDSDGRTTHSIIERATAFLRFIQGEAA